MGARPLLAASVAFCFGAFFVLPWWLAPLPLLFWKRGRPVAIGLALGLLRASFSEVPPPQLPPAEFEARVESPSIVRFEGQRLSVSLRGIEVHRGDRALLAGKFHAPPHALNPGGRDRSAQLRAQGISLEGNAEVLRVIERGPWLFRKLDEVRARFAARAAQLCSPERAALLTALATGDRRGISREDEDELAASGLVHLLASSGLHLFILVWLSSLGTKWLWLRTPWATRVRPALVAAIVSVTIALLETLLLGAPWPAVRAFAAVAISLLASALARRSDAPTTLFLAAAICAAIDPGAAHDLALQLSVAGIAGLLFLAQPLRELLPIAFPAAGSPVARRLLEKVLRLACSTAAAALCTAPLLATSFHRLSLVSVLANAIALPPGLLAIPLSTALLVVDWLPLWWLADLAAGITLQAAHLFSALPFATVSLAAPGLLAAALWYTAVYFAARRSRKAVALFAAATLLLLAPRAEAHFDKGMRITFLAVGQGDAAIVQLPGGHALLIDGGGDLRWPGRFDPGARDVLPALAELGISRLDLVVLSHPHPDHAGGLLTVLQRVPVDELWMNEEDNAISRAVRAKHAAVLPHDETIAGVKLEVLSQFVEGRSTNDNSIVLRLTLGGDSVLFAGDAEALAESALAQKDLRADLLKAPHHGSRTSSTDAFLRAVQPKFTVYSAGAGNSFNFPNAEVVARTPGEHFVTATGAIIAETHGSGWIVRPFQP